MKRASLLLAFPLVTALVSCGSDPTYPLTITLDSTPVVIDTPFTYESYRDPTTQEPVYTTIQPAWFLAGYSVQNNGSAPYVTIVSLTVEVDIPADLTTNPDGDAQKSIGTCNFVADLSTSGTTYLVEVTGAQTIAGVSVPAPSPIPISKNLYCSNLQFPKGTSYKTSGRVYPKGWIGRPTKAEDRLNVEPISFSTK